MSSPGGVQLDSRITAVEWASDRAGDALHALALRAGLVDRHRAAGALGGGQTGSVQEQLAARAGALDVSVHDFPIEDDLFRGLRKALPAIVPAASGGLVAIADWKRGRFLLVRPGGATALVEPVELVQSLASVGSGGTRTLDLLSDRTARKRAVVALVTELAARGEPLRVWRVRRGETGLLKQAWREGVLPATAAFLGSHLAQYLLFLQAWIVLGKESFSGSTSAAGLAAWSALLAGVILFRSLTSWLQGQAGRRAARLLRRRVFDGILQIDPDTIRHQGTGQLLGRVIDAETVQDLAVTGGLVALMSVLELTIAGSVLALGPGGALRGALLAMWFGLVVVLAVAYQRKTARWTEQRHRLSFRLVERMVGHRTRLAQQSPEHWHDGEESDRSEYERLSIPMDRLEVVLRSTMHRGWMVIGVASIALMRGSPEETATAVGGVLLAFQAFQLLALGLVQLSGAAVAWREVEPLLGLPRPADSRPRSSREPVVELQDLAFFRPGREQPILRSVDLVVSKGDRILLEGRSGSGKSTLGALLAGLKEPSGGSVDRRGEVILSPQFHENHLLLAPLTFNILMGRHWPASSNDLEEVRRVCNRLGLGSLLSRMPSGMAQMVGETGWRLSHGERSLVFVARTIVQRPDLLVLDESFGSLDPLTLSSALPVVVEESPALMVIRQ
ncbi:MAG TPA: ABC transporter ATP-binding protein [Actinomycetota bacterium]|nr:ABC transporter ATP-binding protein [Actinomycetota bacterium]